MHLIITIDTEEDNWSRYSTTDNSLANLERLAPLQNLFDKYQVKPTYLISYPVATNARTVELLRGFADEDKCEIGMHCHPWNTPPFEERICEYNSMLCNLPPSLIEKKLTVLHEAICENFDMVPVSFRAGRWGFGSPVAHALCRLGYQVDTSVSPFVDWREYCGPNFTDFPLHPYRLDPDDIAIPSVGGALYEIPASVGFLQRNFARCQKWTNHLGSEIPQKLRLRGMLSRLGLLNKVWFSPEMADGKGMVKLARRFKKENYPCLNMFFHSTTLLAGLSPFTKSRKDEERFLRRIEHFLDYWKGQGLPSCSLREFPVYEGGISSVRSQLLERDEHIFDKEIKIMQDNELLQKTAPEKKVRSLTKTGESEP